MTVTSNYLSQIPGEDRRQKERLTVGLKRLIRSYPEGVTILKELLQNADDAGARRLVLTVDWRDHRPNATADEYTLREWLGPGLLAWNDSRFRSEDFDAISRIGESSKVEDITKTGRFGVGFNSVYNVTDFPCFVSCNRVVFFDPHERYIQGNNAYTFGRDGQAPDLWTHLPTLRSAFEAGGLNLDEDGAFGATLFRFPFRVAEHAEASEIKQEAFDREAMERLLQVFAADGENLLLFLKNVLSIEILEIESDGSRRTRLYIGTVNEDEVTGARESIAATLKQTPESFLAQCQMRASTLPVSCYKQIITTLTWSQDQADAQEKQSAWRIVNGLRADSSGAIAKSMAAMAASGNKAVPWAGAAARLSTSVPDASPIVGRSFCFLPLHHSTATGLPVHIHGFFDLDDSRTNLTNIDPTLIGNARVRGEWNRLLVQHAVAPLCARLVEALKEDIGEDVKQYYSQWPIQKPSVKALEGLDVWILQLLKNAEVIRVDGHKMWAAPSMVQTIKPDFRDLIEPLSLMGYNIPPNDLPFNAVVLSHLKIEQITPAGIRSKLQQPVILKAASGVMPSEASHPALQRREWIVRLLRFCLSDGTSSVLNLPLALREDGTLSVFDGKAIFDGNTAVRTIFATRPQWFIASDLRALVPELDNIRQGFLIFGPGAVAVNLGNLYTSLVSDQPWEPEGEEIPNASWLAHVYRYLTALPAGTLTENLLKSLRSCPLVPGTNGRLYNGGDALTPLQANRMSIDIQQALRRFKVRLVGNAKNEELGKAIVGYIRSHPDELIFQTTAHDVVDTIYAQSEKWVKAPPSEVEFDALLDFLADNFAHLEADEKRLEKLRQMPLYRIQGVSNRVAIKGEQVYLTGAGYRPPNIAGSMRLVQTGENERWRPLLTKLGIPELDRVRLLCDFVLPKYNSLSPEQKKEAFLWIRENLDAAQGDLRRKGDRLTDLKKEVQKHPLVQCSDGQFRLVGDVYNPESASVRNILGNTAPFPDFSRTYIEDSRAWRDFFISLGWRSEPFPQDIVSRIDYLVSEAGNRGIEAVESNLRAVFEYVSVASRWEQTFAEAQVIDGVSWRAFSSALSRRSWIPVQGSPQYLQDFPAARVPEERLYRSNEVTFSQYGNQAASQFAIFRVNNPPNFDIQRALGFPVPGSDVMNNAVLSHFEHFLTWFSELPQEEQTDRNAWQALSPIYNYFKTHFVRKQDSHRSLQARFCELPCLWDGRRFWSPKKCFASKADIFGPWRGNVHGGELNDVYVMLGQPPTPTVVDFVQFLREMYVEYDGAELAEQDVEIVRKVSRALAREAGETPPGSLHGLPLLSANCRLVPCQKLLINDDPYRAAHVESQISRSELSLLYWDTPADLAAFAGCPSLFEDVYEQLTSPPKTAPTQQCAEWTSKLKSPEFSVALRRLARHQGREEKLIEGVEQRLKRMSFVASEELVVDLYLRGTNVEIAKEVPTNFYTDQRNSTIYIWRADGEETMRSFCAEALNRDVLGAALDDLSILEKLFNRKPGEYERFLNDRRVRTLTDEIQDETDESDEQPVIARLAIPDETVEPEVNSQVEDIYVAAVLKNALDDSTAINVKILDAIPISRETNTAEVPDEESTPEQNEQGATDSLSDETLNVEPQTGSPSSPFTVVHKDDEIGATPTPSGRANSGGTSSPWPSASTRSSNNSSQHNGRRDDSQADNSEEPKPVVSDHKEDLGDPALDEAQGGEAESLPLPDAHTPYGGQIHARTPIRPIDDDLLRHNHPEAKIVSMTEEGASRRTSRRSRSLPGYTGPQEPVTSGQIMLLARSLRDGMLHLRSPKPAALFQSDEAQQDTKGLFFPTVLLGEDDKSEPIQLRVDYNKEVLHFDEGADRERILMFLAEHELYPGCQLTVRLLENGFYRIGYENDPSTVTPVPLLGLDADGKPIVTWSAKGIQVPCPVDRQLFIGLRRVVDEEASRALWLMAEDAPDILEALQRLLRDRSAPVSQDDLYRLNYHIRPVSYAYFMSVLQSNIGVGKLFLQSPEGISLNPEKVTEIITPRMSSSGMKQHRREIDWERLRQVLIVALTELVDAEFEVEYQVEYVILALKEGLA